MTKGLAYAWSSFLGSLLFLLVVDYATRIGDGDVRSGGINLILFWLIWLPFLAFSLHWLWRAGQELQSQISTALFMLVNLAAALLAFATLTLLYTVEMGIDSL